MILASLSAGGALASREADPQGPAPRQGANASLDETFAKAAALRKQADDEDDPARQRALPAEFAEALRGAAGAFPEVPVSTGKAPTRFAKLTLNRRRENFDAIRFKAPRGAASWDLLWEFVIPMRDSEHDLTGWYIVPGSGDLRGFRNYSQAIDDPLEGVDLPRHRHVAQGLGGGAIKPGATYLIWFTFREGTGDVPMYVKSDRLTDADHADCRWLPATRMAGYRQTWVESRPGSTGSARQEATLRRVFGWAVNHARATAPRGGPLGGSAGAPAHL